MLQWEHFWFPQSDNVKYMWLFKTLTTTNCVLLYQYITQTGLLYYLLPLLLVFDWFSVHVLWTINQCSSHCHTHLWLLLLVISSSSTSSSPSFRPTPTTCTIMVRYLVVLHSTAHTSWLSWSMRIDLCDAADSFRTTLWRPSWFPRVGTRDPWWSGIGTRPCHQFWGVLCPLWGWRLFDVCYHSELDKRGTGSEGSVEYLSWMTYWPIAWYFGDIVVGWCRTRISPSNSQQHSGFMAGCTSTMPFLIWLRRTYIDREEVHHYSYGCCLCSMHTSSQQVL